PEAVQQLRGLLQRVQFGIQLLTLTQLLATLSPSSVPGWLRSSSTRSPRRRPTQSHDRQTRSKIGDVLPTDEAWPTVGPWTPTARSSTRSRNASPPSHWTVPQHVTVTPSGWPTNSPMPSTEPITTKTFASSYSPAADRTSASAPTCPRVGST